MRYCTEFYFSTDNFHWIDKHHPQLKHFRHIFALYRYEYTIFSTNSTLLFLHTKFFIISPFAFFLYLCFFIFSSAERTKTSFALFLFFVAICQSVLNRTVQKTICLCVGAEWSSRIYGSVVGRVCYYILCKRLLQNTRRENENCLELISVSPICSFHFPDRKRKAVSGEQENVSFYPLSARMRAYRASHHSDRNQVSKRLSASGCQWHRWKWQMRTSWLNCCFSIHFPMKFMR